MNWKILAGFFAGGIVGGLGTWFGVRKFYEHRAESEIKEMRDFYMAKYHELTDDNPEELEDIFKKSDTERPTKSVKEHYNTFATQYNTMHKEEKPSLEALRASMEHPEEEGEDYVEFTGESDLEGLECVREANPEDLPGPVIISEEDYASDWRFEKVTITYYVGDKTLADEDETIMDDIENTVSQKAIDWLVNEDFDAVYVRNEKLGIDYEIVYNEGLYSEIVLGFYTDEEVGGRVPIKKRKDKMNEEEE